MFSYLVDLYIFIFGAIFGSFANVIIVRLPLGESISLPRSFCRTCKKPVKFYDNIPIFSWLYLRGKCRSCQSKIPFRYPLVEILMGLSFVAAFYFYGFTWTFLESIIFLFGLITVSFIDIDHYILPDIFTYSGMVIGLIGAFLNPERSFTEAVIGLFLGGGFLWAIAYFYFVFRKQEGMGGGDIKLIAWIGAVLGWQAVPFVIFASSIIGTIGGLILASRNKQGMKTVIPYGPYLALAAILFMFGGQELAKSYLTFFIPGL